MRTELLASPRAAARNQRFRLGVAALVERLGGRPSGSLVYEHVIDTPLGELALSPVNSDIGPWLACRFRDVTRAKHLHDERLNPFSGKWNHMHDDLEAIERALIHVLAFQPDGLDESSLPHRLTA